MIPLPPSDEDELRATGLAAALRELTSRYTALFERSLAGAFRTTAGGRVLQVNPAAAALLGYSGPEELEGSSAEAHYAEAADRRALLLRLAAEGEVTADLNLRGRDGATLRARIRAALRTDLDGQQVVEGTVVDLTRSGEAHDRLLDAARLAAVGAASAGVAHEVNNPLAGLLANLTFALEALPGLRAGAEPLADLAGALQDARGAAERVRDVIRDLRVLSRLDAGAPAPLAPAPIMEAVLALVHNQLRHRARLVRALEDAPEVVASEPVLGQVLLNLLLEATQVIPEGAAAQHMVRVSTGRAAGGEALIEVACSGPGLPGSAPDDPFDPQRPGARGHPACVGLPAARPLAEALEGELSVRREPGGLTMRLTLPAAPQPAPETVAGGRARRRVLVVDDEAVVGKSLRRLLPEHEVTLTTDAAQALAAIEADPAFDVILCDVMMPEISGVELYQVLQVRFPSVVRRVAFITGGTFSPETGAFLKSCGAPVLEKPFDLVRLRALVAGRPPAAP